MPTTKAGFSATNQPHVNPHESLNGLARFFAEGFKKQAVDEGINKLPTDFYRELTGAEVTTPRKGDLKPGQELNLAKIDAAPAKPTRSPEAKARREGEVLGGIDYRREIVHGSERIHTRQNSEVEQKIQQIMQELQRLVDSSQVISNEYLHLAVDQKPVASGTYHLNFFDFMLSVIRSARQKVEDSGAWMQISKKKNGYQQKSQSLGTKFSLSHERSVATQSG